MNKKKIMLLWAIMAVTAYGSHKNVAANIELDETVVYSTTGFATDMRKVAATPTVITSKQIEEKNYKNIAEMLEDVPAISVSKDAFGTTIDMRGQGSSIAKRNVQILVDGVAVNSLDTSMTSTPINTVPINDIERIEIIPGGGSVLYGTGTAGGVINIITKKRQGTRGTVGYQRSSYEGNKYDVQVGHSIGNFDIDVTYNKADAYGYRDESKDTTEFVQGKVKYNINENQFVEFKYSNYDGKIFGASEDLTKAELEANRKQAKGSITRVRTQKDDYTVNYNAKLREDLELSVLGFHQKTNMRLSTKGDNVSMPSDFDDKKVGIKPKLKYTYGQGEHAGSSIVFGVDYVDNDAQRLADMVGITKNDFSKKTIGAFAMNNLKWGDFEFNQGIRYEKSNYTVKRSKPGKDLNASKTEDNFAAELSGTYLYSETGKVYTRVEQGFTSPPPALLSDTVPTGRFVYYPMPDGSTFPIAITKYVANELESETYRSVEFGWSEYLFNNTTVNTSVFYTLTNDEIYTSMVGMGTKVLNYNIDKTQRYGAEIALNHYFGKLTLSESYNYTKAKIKEGTEKKYNNQGNRLDGDKLDGKYMPGVPTHKFKVGAKYDFTENFNINGEVVYTGKSYINTNNAGGQRDSYTVANLRAAYEFDNGLDLYVGVNNLFDKKYNDTVNFEKGEYTYSPAAERNYYAGFRYTF